MKLRRYMGLIIACSIALVLGVIALVMLVKFNSTYQRVRGDLATTTSRLNMLYGRDPYPSQQNVDLVQSNLTVLDGYFSDLLTILKKGQIEPEEMEPAEFPLLLARTIRELYGQAMRAGVRLPDRFTFGFDRYAKGALPNTEDVPRLVMQVKTVEQLCDLLYEAKVAEILGVKRTVFEKGLVEVRTDPSDRRAARRRRSRDDREDLDSEEPGKEWTDPSGLFSRETYTLEFEASDPSISALLDLMGKSPLFLSVARAELENNTPLPKIEPVKEEPSVLPTTSRRMPSLSGGHGGVSTLPSVVEGTELVNTHEDRIVMGRELVKIALQLHVYRFLSEENEEAGP